MWFGECMTRTIIRGSQFSLASQDRRVNRALIFPHEFTAVEMRNKYFSRSSLHVYRSLSACHLLGNCQLAHSSFFTPLHSTPLHLIPLFTMVFITAGKLAQLPNRFSSSWTIRSFSKAYFNTRNQTPVARTLSSSSSIGSAAAPAWVRSHNARSFLAYRFPFNQNALFSTGSGNRNNTWITPKLTSGSGKKYPPHNILNCAGQLREGVGAVTQLNLDAFLSPEKERLSTAPATATVKKDLVLGLRMGLGIRNLREKL